MLFKNARLIERVRQILGFSAGGVHKRIDENRELLELLQREAPELLAKNFWIEGWIKSNDEFFCDIEKAVPIQRGRFLSAALTPGNRFPRPWPNQLPVSEASPLDARIEDGGP